MKRTSFDFSVVTLVLANVLALWLAVRDGLELADILLVFWAQNIIIGVLHVVRLFLLKEFSTRNLQINNRAVQPTRETKLQMIFSFAMLFGCAHVLYFAFLVTWATPVMGRAFWIGALVFAINHLFSLVYNLRNDRSGRPNIDTLVSLPILRMLPMHLCLWAGAALDLGVWTLVLFGGLKTFADAAMHVYEHRQFRRRHG
jgi:signal transduction histidine kinase